MCGRVECRLPPFLRLLDSEGLAAPCDDAHDPGLVAGDQLVGGEVALWRRARALDRVDCL